MSIESIGKFVLAIAVIVVYRLAIRRHRMRRSMTRLQGTTVHPSSRTNGHLATFSMREITPAAYSVMPPRLKLFSDGYSGGSQMLGQQLQAIQRDMMIVRQENASNPKSR